MHYREYSNHILVCDACQEQETFETFEEMVNHKKQVGWCSFKDEDGDWQDICPYCNGLPTIVLQS